MRINFNRQPDMHLRVLIRVLMWVPECTERLILNSKRPNSFLSEITYLFAQPQKIVAESDLHIGHENECGC